MIKHILIAVAAIIAVMLLYNFFAPSTESVIQQAIKIRDPSPCSNIPFFRFHIGSEPGIVTGSFPTVVFDRNYCRNELMTLRSQYGVIILHNKQNMPIYYDALDTNNPQLCLQIEDYEDRRACLFQLRETYMDPSVCEAWAYLASRSEPDIERAQLDNKQSCQSYLSIYGRLPSTFCDIYLGENRALCYSKLQYEYKLNVLIPQCYGNSRQITFIDNGTPVQLLPRDIKIPNLCAEIKNTSIQGQSDRDICNNNFEFNCPTN